MSKNGFSLIEVIVVMSVIALVSALGFAVFGESYREAKNKKAATHVYKELKTVADAYSMAIEKGYVPTTDELNGETAITAGTLKSKPALPFPNSGTSSRFGFINDEDVVGDVFSDTFVYYDESEGGMNDGICAQINSMQGTNEWTFCRKECAPTTCRSCHSWCVESDDGESCPANIDEGTGLPVDNAHHSSQDYSFGCMNCHTYNATYTAMLMPSAASCESCHNSLGPPRAEFNSAVHYPAGSEVIPCPASGNPAYRSYYLLEKR